MSDQLPPKKFFKIPENFAEATDAEIDAFAQSIMEQLFKDRENAMKTEGLAD